MQVRFYFCFVFLPNFCQLNFRLFYNSSITRPNCALDRCTILCLYVPGFQRQVFKHVEILSERLKRMKEQRERVLVAESAHNSQNSLFGLVMSFAFQM